MWIVTGKPTDAEPKYPHSRKRKLSEDSACDKSPKRSRTGPSPSPLASVELEPPGLSLPFTNEFFSEMAAIINKLFPIRSFAQAHRCDTTDVLDALNAVVLHPLREPQIWNGSMSVSDYAQVLIADWRASQMEIGIAGKRDHPITIIDDTDNEGDSNSQKAKEEKETKKEEVNSNREDKRSYKSSSFAEISTLPEQIDGRKAKEEEEEEEEREESDKGNGGKDNDQVVDLSEDSDSFIAISTPSEEMSSPRSALGTNSEIQAQIQNQHQVDQQRQMRQKSPVRRIRVRLDQWGMYVPVHKWIDGVNTPRSVRSEAVTDEKFTILQQEGYFQVT